MRGVTLLSQDSRPVAALIHDPILDTDSALVEGLAASAPTMLENARLVAELHASRARIVETAETSDGVSSAICTTARSSG